MPELLKELNMQKLELFGGGQSMRSCFASVEFDPCEITQVAVLLGLDLGP